MTLRIDSHHHFWHYNPTEHVWMTEGMESLMRDYLPNELASLLEKNGIAGTVAVQARQNLEETAWLLGLAEQHDFVKGVVGWVDLRSSNVTAQLEQYAPHPKLKGVRHVIHDESDDTFMVGAEFLRGLGELQAFGLTYDLLLFPRHLPVAATVVKRFPEQAFVLDHIGKPCIRKGTLSPWEEQLKEFARIDNVYCKLSGMVTEASWDGWHATEFFPYLDIVFECFGVDRVMFGSDWPVCTLSASYSEVVEVIKNYIHQLSLEEQTKVFGGNATSFYKLSGEVT